MARQGTYDLVDLIIPGGLEPKLVEWRNVDRLTIEEVQFKLRSEYGVKVTTNTVWRWLQRVGVSRLGPAGEETA